MNTQHLTSAYQDLIQGWEDIQHLARERWLEYRAGQDADRGGQPKINQARKGKIASRTMTTKVCEFRGSMN